MTEATHSNGTGSTYKRMSLREATNIGHQCLAMGLVTHDQLAAANVHYEEAEASGRQVRFGEVLLELGMVSAADLSAAEDAQNRARDTRPPNQSATEDALRVLRQAATAHLSTTETRLRALSPNDHAVAARGGKEEP